MCPPPRVIDHKLQLIFSPSLILILILLLPQVAHTDSGKLSALLPPSPIKIMNSFLPPANSSTGHSDRQ